MKVAITAEAVAVSITSSTGETILSYSTPLYTLRCDVKALIEEIGLLSRMAMAMEEPAPKERAKTKEELIADVLARAGLIRP